MKFVTCYDNLPNVEHETTDCTSITITSAGSRIQDVIEVRHMKLNDVCNQVEAALQQLQLMVSLTVMHAQITYSLIALKTVAKST